VDFFAEIGEKGIRKGFYQLTKKSRGKIAKKVKSYPSFAKASDFDKASPDKTEGRQGKLVVSR